MVLRPRNYCHIAARRGKDGRPGLPEKMPPAAVPPIEQLRITLAICAKIGGFRGREHVDWLIRQGEGASARSGYSVR